MTSGLTVIVAVVAPVLQRKESPPIAVRVFEPPGQIEPTTQIMLHCGATISSLTITSAKQLSDVFKGFVITKRYVPGSEIRIESRPLTTSLMPGPMATLFLHHINVGFTKSVLYVASRYCDVTMQFNSTGGRMSTTHCGAPGAIDTLQVLWQPVARSVTCNVMCTWKPGAPQSPEENVIDWPVLEPTIAHPAGLPSTAILHEKLNNAGFKLVPMV